MVRHVVFFCLIALLLVPAATAGNPAGNPAVDQYRESVPSGTGAQPLGTNQGQAPQPLSPTLVKHIKAAAPAAAPLLQAIASQPADGAVAPLPRVGPVAAAASPSPSPSLSAALLQTRAAVVFLLLIATALAFYLLRRLRARRST